jgi:hypothetical protein
MTTGIVHIRGAANARPTATLPDPVTDLDAVRVQRRKVVHGLINEYEQAA